MTDVVTGSQAAAAGLRKYDVITRVAGGAATGDNVVQAKQSRDYGDKVEFEVRRGGEHLRLQIAVGEQRH